MNKKLRPPSAHASKRDGIALVVVLGLLSLLIILAVAFSIAMRTERMATRSYLDVVKARHLVHAALNRVLDEELSIALAGKVYPDWDAYSISSGALNLLGDRTVNSGTVFVPASLRPAAFAADGVDWEPLTDPVNGRFYGEYAFMIVNCSGLLDANVIGAFETETNPRGYGVNPGEIRFNESLLNEIYSGGSKSLSRYREEFRKFESVSELYYLTSTTDFESSLGTRPLKQNVNQGGPWADHLHVFSRYPLGYADVGLRANNNVAYIGGNPADWDLDKVRSVLSDLQAPTQIPDLDAFVGVLYDYADEGYIPYPFNPPDENRQFRRISAKPVPMVNEVIVSNSLKLVDNGVQQTLEHRIYVTVETWYPFPNNPENASFLVDLTAPPQLPQVAPPYPNFLNAPVLESGPTPANFNPSPSSAYKVTTYVYLQRQDVNGPGQLPYNPGGSFAARVVIPGNIRVLLNTAARPQVDVVFGPWGDNDFRLVGPRPSLTANADEVGVASQARAANDPRINWDPRNGAHWASVSPSSPGERNNARISGAYSDELDFMYCRRGPIESVGELGYLLYSATRPWETIRLIGENPAIGAKVLDRLTTYNATNFPRRGLVNINTRQTNALMATIWTMPVDKYPGDSAGSRLDNLNDARTIAQHLIDRVANQGAITNLSSLSERVQPTVLDPILVSNNDKFRRESLIRNSIGLWGTRHQLFTIFVAARTFADAYDPARDFAARQNFVTAEQRAVAVVWRDPFETTDSAGNTTHQSWVQFFHWFSGAFGE